MRKILRAMMAACAATVIIPSAVLAAEYINAAGGAWETPANWDIGVVPTKTNTITIAGSPAGQTVVMDTNSWNYIIASNLNHDATTYRTLTVSLADTGSVTMNVDIGAGNKWVATSGGSYYVGNASGSDGTLNVLSGNANFEASLMYLGWQAGSKGQINITGADAGYIAGRESSGVSLVVGPAGEGSLYISDGSFLSRAGVAVGTNGTFDVAGSAVAEVGVGSHNTINGSWQQESNGVLRVGIDSGGITPILIDDVNASGPDGAVSAAFEDGAVLQPYFIGGSRSGKWTVMLVDGEILDYGLVLDTGGDSDWSFNVVSNYILEVWYGLGDSGYTPDEPPVYEAGDIYWDGEAGDFDWDNPVNWLSVSNNTLPLVGDANVKIDAITNYARYTADYGSRSYHQLDIGVNADGRLDVLGSGYTLGFGQKTVMDCALNGNTGILNLDGGATLDLGVSIYNIGNGSGSTGIVTVANGSLLKYGRESGGLSGRVGQSSGNGTLKIVGTGQFTTRAGLEVGVGGTGLFSVQGAGGLITIGNPGSVDGKWTQGAEGTLQALVATNGLTTIFIDDYNEDGGGDVYFNAGSLLDVGFTGFAGENGSWDVMEWEGSLAASNLSFAAGVDTNIWSFAFVDAGVSTNGVDTLRITATGFAPTVTPDISAFSVSGTDVSLTWDSEAGYNYNVVSKTALTDSTWTTNVAGIPSGGASTSTNLTRSAGTTEFYAIEAY